MFLVIPLALALSMNWVKTIWKTQIRKQKVVLKLYPWQKLKTITNEKKKLHQKQDSEFRPADLIFRIPIANFLTIPVLLWACYREAKKKSRAQKLTKLVNPEYEGLRKRKSRQNLENKNRSSSSPNYYITKGQYSRYCFDRRGYFLLKIFRNSLKLELKRKQ